MPRASTLTALFVLALLLPGCDGWKRADHAAGLLLVPNVDTVTENGRRLIRIRSKTAVAFVDPAGGKVVDYHLQRRAAFTYDDNPAQPESMKRTEKTYPSGPNVFSASGGWQTSSDNSQRDESLMWQVDAGSIYLTLLSDTVEGLRWRKTFELHDNGVLDITVALQNTTGSTLDARAEATVVAPTAPAVQGRTEHRWSDGQWLSRTLMSPADGAGFSFGPRPIAAHAALDWSERWWITPANDSSKPPQEALRIPVHPVDKYISGHHNYDGD